MLSYLIITIPTLLLSAVFLKLDRINIVNEYITVRRNKLKSLYDLVATRHNSRFMIVFVSTKMLTQSFYQSLVQYLDNSVVKIDKNKYELTYIINGKLYKKIIMPERGPIPVISIINENGCDVTDQILPYMGPNNNFHNENFFPTFFGHKKLIFEMSNGDTKIFDENEKILF